MEIQPIRNEQDYEATLREIAELMEAEPEPGTTDFERLEVLTILVEDYEDEHHSVEHATPVETIEFHLDRLGWTQARLAREADLRPSHLSAVLNRRRTLSLTQIKKLSAVFDIPADLLIENEYQSEGSRRASRA